MLTENNANSKNNSNYHDKNTEVDRNRNVMMIII